MWTYFGYGIVAYLVYGTILVAFLKVRGNVPLDAPTAFYVVVGWLPMAAVSLARELQDNWRRK
jgi:hypothetical protein